MEESVANNEDLNTEDLNQEYKSPLNYHDFIEEGHINNYKSMIMKSSSSSSNESGDEMY